MALYRKKPVEIEAIEFGVEPMPEDIKVIDTAEGGKVYNQLHESWINVKKGDMVRIDQAPDDVYPIDRETFEKTYEPVDGHEAE
jgi:hypothetical protein